MLWLPGLLLLGPCPHGKSLQTHASTGDPQTLIGRSGSVSCGVPAPFLGSWCTQGFVCALQESLIGVGFDFNVIAPLLPSCCSFSFVLGCWISFFVCRFQHPPVDGCLENSSNFGILTEDEHTSFYCAIFHGSTTKGSILFFVIWICCYSCQSSIQFYY